MLYEKIIRPVLFKLTDPESIHHSVIAGMGAVSRSPLYGPIHSYCAVNDDSLKVRLGPLELPNPLGLGAGFDKGIDAPYAYPMLGFGWAELGSITFNQQDGNRRPRLWRLPKDKGLIVFYGLPNPGAAAVGEALKTKLNRPHPVPLGISIAPSTKVPFEVLEEDYMKSLALVYQQVDFITLNVSCPNVANKDMFSQLSFITQLMKSVRKFLDAHAQQKPFFIKIHGEHTPEELETLAQTAVETRCTGIITANLLKNRARAQFASSPAELEHPGGISGKHVAPLSLASVRQLYKAAGGKVHIIGLGGIFTAEDAYQRIRAGASALQLITGFIYGGPTVLKQINTGLAALLKRDGFKNISEAVGVDVK
jgi:dihydroorotate dehydrogenase